MASHRLLVFTDAVEGRESDYNDWYNGIHLREVLELPGFVGAQRFSVSAALPGSEAPRQKYLAVYEIEADDLDAALKGLSEATPSMTISDALDRSSVTAYTVTALGSRVGGGST